MNHKKRYFTIIIFIILILQLYWIHRSEGNLNIIVQNHSIERIPVHLIIYLDDNEILNDTLINSVGILSHNSFSSVGRHKIRINDMTNDKEYEWDVFLFPVTWYEINVRSVNEINLNQNFIPSIYQ